MRVLIVRDDGQLRRIDSALARFEAGSPAEQCKKTCLLAALQSERAELLRHGSRAGRRQAPTAAAA
jgi:hypothetical protein